jgi:hypothetical protein
MAKSLPKKYLVSFKELLIANSIQVDALAQLLIEWVLGDKYVSPREWRRMHGK